MDSTLVKGIVANITGELDEKDLRVLKNMNFKLEQAGITDKFHQAGVFYKKKSFVEQYFNADVEAEIRATEVSAESIQADEE